MCNCLKPERQKQVLHMLVEGASIRSTARLTGVHKNTIGRLMVRFGEGCRVVLDKRLRELTLRHVELDEIWTFVAKKQGRLTPGEKAERFDIGDVYVWTALDKHTKLVASFLVGKRSADSPPWPRVSSASSPTPTTRSGFSRSGRA
jgi:transposase